MQFQHPGYLFFLAFLAIPIILHLYSFRQYKTFYFSSISFLKNIEQESKSIRKLKQILILISRLLAVFFLVLTFSQPFIPLKENKIQSGGNVLVLYIDNSFSMSQLGIDGQLLSMAKEQAKKIINKTQNNTKILLFTNNLNAVEEQFTSKTNLLNRLEKIKIQSNTIPIQQVIERIQDIVNHHKEISTNTTKQFIYLSDFQYNSLKKTISIEDKNQSYFYPFKLQPQKKGNVSIDSIWFDEPNFKTKINNELHVKVTNYSDEDTKNLELVLDINKTKRTVFVDIEKEKSKEVVINYTDYQTGIKNGKIHLNDKHLNFDDDFYFTYDVKPYSSILIINGEDFNKSIAQVFSLDNYYKVSEINIGSFLPENLKNKQLVVLNGVKDLNQGLTLALKNFQSKGGSLLLFPGVKANLNEWNSFLNSIGISSLNPFEKTSLDSKDLALQSSFFKGVFEQKPNNIQLPKVKGFFPTKNNINSSLISLQNNKSLILKQNNSYLFTSILDSTYSTITSNSLYPVILLRIAELSQNKTTLFHFLGAENRIQIFSDEVISSSKKSNTEFHLKNDQIDLIPYTEELNNETFISLVGLQENKGLTQGTYQVINDNIKSTIALNYQRLESNIKTFSDDEITSFFKDAKSGHLTFSSVDAGSQTLKVDLEKPQEFWRFFLILALIFVLTEMALTRFMK